MRYSIAAVLFLLATPAMAQSADPCTPGNSSFKIGGVDLTELQCNVQVMREAIAQQSLALISHEATQRITQAKVAAGQAEIAALNKKIAEQETKIGDLTKKPAAPVASPSPTATPSP